MADEIDDIDAAIRHALRTDARNTSSDTAVYGSGSKVTHNPVGNVGVYQGNGGDREGPPFCPNGRKYHR